MFKQITMQDFNEDKMVEQVNDSQAEVTQDDGHGKSPGFGVTQEEQGLGSMIFSWTVMEMS